MNVHSSANAAAIRDDYRRAFLEAGIPFDFYRRDLSEFPAVDAALGSSPVVFVGRAADDVAHLAARSILLKTHRPAFRIDGIELKSEPDILVRAIRRPYPGFLIEGLELCRGAKPEFWDALAYAVLKASSLKRPLLLTSRVAFDGLPEHVLDLVTMVRT